MGDHEHSTIQHKDHTLLDQSLIRLPYELLRNNFRAAHFTVEKDSTSIKAMLKDTATSSVNGRAPPDQVLRNLDTMIAKMRGVKRKLETYTDEEARLYRQTGARVGHIAELWDMNSYDDVKYETWSRKRLDRLLVDYLLRRGYTESATALKNEKGLEDLADVKTFTQMNKIKEALRKESVTEALQWCQDNKKELRKKDSNLEFMLRFQQYIELVRAQNQPKMLEAIAHSKKYLLPSRKTYPEEIRKAFGLLAYPPTASISSYDTLYSHDRWEMLADLFVKTHNELLDLSTHPLLHIALTSGLSAIKTPACHSSITTAQAAAPGDAVPDAAAPNGAAPVVTSMPTVNDDNDEDDVYIDAALPHPYKPAFVNPASACPTCSTELNELARTVPYAHHTKSAVASDLVLLPNRAAYSREMLYEHARKSGLDPEEMVRDLRTGEIFPRKDIRKIYIS